LLRILARNYCASFETFSDSVKEEHHEQCGRAGVIGMILGIGELDTTERSMTKTQKKISGIRRTWIDVRNGTGSYINGRKSMLK